MCGARSCLALLCFLAASMPAASRVVDCLIADDRILHSIVDYLDKSGIVVRNGRAAELEPSFTQLSNFPANKSLAGPTDAFDPAFSAGVHSERAYLAAVDNRGMAQPT